MLLSPDLFCDVAPLLLWPLSPSPGGLLPPTVLFAYSAWVCYQALGAQENNACNPQASGDASSIAIGLVIAALALTWTTARTTNSAPNLFRSAAAADAQGGEGGGGGAESEAAREKREARREAREKRNAERRSKKKKGTEGTELTRQASGGSSAEDVEVNIQPTLAAGEAGEEEEEEGGEEHAWFFHLFMALGAVYMAMLITKWKHFDPMQMGSDPENMTSLYVKIVSQWLTFAVYWWTLVAPKVCANRSFDDAHNSLRGY